VIRVCHIITGLYTGGAEMMLYKLLSATDRRRFEPAVISLIDRGALGERIEALGIPVFPLNMRLGRPSPLALARLVRLLRRWRPKLLQGWMYHGNIAASLAGPLLPGRPPVLWNIRQTLYELEREKTLTRGMIRLSARLSGSARFIVYNSRVSAGQHEARGFRDERRVILPNGFDGEAFAPSAEVRRRWREDLGFSERDLLIGLAARYHPMKDHDNFLRAAARLAGRFDEARFVLAGRGVDGENGELAARIRELGLSGRVRLLGDRADMAPFFQSLDIAALASAWGEGFPNVLGEAMASGVPCVATDVGDAADIVGETGLVVPPRDPESLASALAELAGLGPEARNRLGARARERILERYALPAIVARYEALHAEAVGRPDL
jgi:glycosyltransferase involved in cell wall biosynthesis